MNFDLDAGSDRESRPCTMICFSHLRWRFVFQRPQHLMTRAARHMRVLFWEEPEFAQISASQLSRELTAEGVLVLTPVLPVGTAEAASLQAQQRLLDVLIAEEAIVEPVLWYYTPQALPFSSHIRPAQIVYDCMDELSAFSGADPSLPLCERWLMQRADLVFTGGYSLYEAKRKQHLDVHPFPSGVDVAHFLPARRSRRDPADKPASRIRA